MEAGLQPEAPAPEMVEEEAAGIIAKAKQEPVRNQAVKRDPASGLLFIFTCPAFSMSPRFSSLLSYAF